MTLIAHPEVDQSDPAGPERHRSDALQWLPIDLVADVALSHSGGVVLLTGTTSSVAAWRRIREAVLAGPGFVVVADQIQVEGARPIIATSTWSERIARSIASTPGLAGSVAVQLDEGVTTLWGRVPNARMRDQVVRAAREVVGGAWIQVRIVTE